MADSGCRAHATSVDLASSASRAGARTVVVVDQDCDSTQTVLRHLDSRYHATVVTTIGEALVTHRERRPDCVVFVSGPPRSDLLEKFSDLVARGVGVVLVTRSFDAETLVAALRAGVHDHVALSDAGSDALTRAIEAAHERASRSRELERYRELVELMPVGAVLCRWEEPRELSSLRFVSRNRAAAAASAASFDYAGVTAAEAFPGFDSDEVAQAFARAGRTGEPQLLSDLRCEDEHTPEGIYDLRLVPLDGHYIAILMENVTEQVRAEEERAALQMRGEANQRLEAIGRLAGGVAHDFNNHLTVISAYAGFLRDEFPEHTPGRADALTVLDAAAKASRLTNQLLAFGRRQVREIKVIEVNDVVGHLASLLRRLLGDGIELVTRLDPKAGFVEADLAQLEDVVVSLVANGREAMRGGGTMTIETEPVRLDDAQGRHRGVDISPGDYVLLAVSDTGPGIDEDMQHHVFEPFLAARTSNGVPRGLGLASVYGIVKQSGGYVWVQSEPGTGSTFKVYLPRVSRVPGSAEGLPVPLSGTETILLVEDEEPVRKAAARMLRQHGYLVIESANSADAVVISERHPDRIDLLVTDVVMPRIGGRELYERVRELRPNIGVVYMSGYTDDAVVQQGALDEGTVFVQKPFATDRLLRAVREGLRPAGATVHALTRAGGRVLVVDDQPYVGAALAAMLTDLGYEVCTATGLAQARAQLDSGETFVAVVCDLDLEGECGIELHDWLLSTANPLAERFLLATGGSIDERGDGYLQRRPHGVVRKPFRHEDLGARLHRVVFGGVDD